MDKFLIVTNQDKDKDLSVTKEIQRYILERGRECQLAEPLVGTNPVETGYTDLTKLQEDIDCVIVLGGDGTFIQTVRDFAGLDIPMVGVTLKQISVFVPNQTGSLEKLVNILAEAGVDMRAMSIADTQEFGIMRMIVKGNTKATTALREAGYLVNISYVTAVEIPDEPGGLAKVVSILASHGVNIEYTYAFMTRSHGKACVVFRVEDNEAAESILDQNGIATLSHLVAEDAPL